MVRMLRHVGYQTGRWASLLLCFCVFVGITKNFDNWEEMDGEEYLQLCTGFHQINASNFKHIIYLFSDRIQDLWAVVEAYWSKTSYYLCHESVWSVEMLPWEREGWKVESLRYSWKIKPYFWYNLYIAYGTHWTHLHSVITCLYSNFPC